MTISGTVRIIGRTAIVDAQPGPCRAVRLENDGPVNSYRCPDMSLFVDQSGDAPRISYSTTRTVTEYKTTCVRYETNSAGARVCALSQRDPVERKVSVSGTVHLTPVATP